jgi:hypothetical protein
MGFYGDVSYNQIEALKNISNSLRIIALTGLAVVAIKGSHCIIRYGTRMYRKYNSKSH